MLQARFSTFLSMLTVCVCLQYFQTSEGLGLYGKDPVHPNGALYVATGDCGRLMSYGTIGGLVIAADIAGWRGLFKDLYSPR